LRPESGLDCLTRAKFARPRRRAATATCATGRIGIRVARIAHRCPFRRALESRRAIRAQPGLIERFELPLLALRAPIRVPISPFVPIPALAVVETVLRRSSEHPRRTVRAGLGPRVVLVLGPPALCALGPVAGVARVARAFKGTVGVGALRVGVAGVVGGICDRGARPVSS